MKSTLLLLAAIGLMIAGCGSSAITVHAAAAEATRTMNDAAVDTIEAECRDRATSAATDPTVDTDTAEANAAEVLDTCEGVRDAQHLFARAHAAWVGFLLQSVRDEDFSLATSLALARNVVALYPPIVRLADRLGIELPELPPTILALIGDP